MPEPGYVTTDAPKSWSGQRPEQPSPPPPFQDGGVIYIWNSNGFAAQARVGEPFSLVCWVPAYVGCPIQGTSAQTRQSDCHSPSRTDIPSSTNYPDRHSMVVNDDSAQRWRQQAVRGQYHCLVDRRLPVDYRLAAIRRARYPSDSPASLDRRQPLSSPHAKAMHLFPGSKCLTVNFIPPSGEMPR
jgi:hypothetical protein